ncbi:MAG: hypothetical protein MRZ74_07380 [Blautia sp.]|nr:hypothetical protein [Blautia sp.]
MYTREELLEEAKPILFNTDMVRVILDGRKTETRRAIKLKYDNTHHEIKTDKYGTRLIEIQDDVKGETFGIREDGTSWRKIRPYIEPKPPYKKGDILYVRETWEIIPCIDCRQDGLPCIFEKIEYEDKYAITEGCFVYRADYPDPEKIVWYPSIHMPKQAARIFLRVTGAWVERLQDIDDNGVMAEGLEIGDPFDDLWNSTIKKKDMDKYGWDANPWVWAIEFERLEVSL